MSVELLNQFCQATFFGIYLKLEISGNPYLDVRIALMPNNKKVQVTFINHLKKEVEMQVCDHDSAIKHLVEIHKLTLDSFTPAINYENYVKNYMSLHVNSSAQNNESADSDNPADSADSEHQKGAQK